MVSIRNPRRITIVSRDSKLGETLSGYLSEDSLRVTTASPGEFPIARGGAPAPDLVIVDDETCPLEEWAAQPEIKRLAARRAIMVIMRLSSSERLERYQELGVVHFLFQPVSRAQCLGNVLALLSGCSAGAAPERSEARAPTGKSRFVGDSAVCRRIRDEIELLAPSDLPILITGETGAGKDVIAQELHRLGDRSDKPFLAVNCATLGSLAESELFGHSRGSFTGAVRSTLGFVGSAEGGVLFLDEIGDLGLEVQAKLLRFLDNQEYMRVGDTAVRKGNVRIISATNLDLEALCDERRFRRDLLFRIAGARIVTRPLRERLEDVSPLVDHFLALFSEQLRRVFSIEPEALAALEGCAWPGNVRQLRQVAFQLCTRCRGGVITLPEVQEALGVDSGYVRIEAPYQEAKRKVMQEFDQTYFSHLLRNTQGQLKPALEVSGMHKKNFYLKMNELGLSLKDYRAFHASRILPSVSAS